MQRKEEVTNEASSLVSIISSEFVKNEHAFKVEPVLEAKKGLLISLLLLKLISLLSVQLMEKSQF
jgi:hypothetical protein